MAKLKELQDKRQQLAAQIKELGERQADWKAEDETQWDALNKAYSENMDAMRGEQERLAKDESVKQRLAEIEAEWRSQNNDNRVGVDQRQREQANPERIAYTRDHDAALALQAWFMRANSHGDRVSREHLEAAKRFGINPNAEALEVRLSRISLTAPASWASCGGSLQTRETRTDAPMYIGGSHVGADFVPTGFATEFEKKMVAYDGPRSVARIWQTATGNAMPWPTVDDTSNSGALLAENTAMADSLAATTGQISFDAYKYESKPIQVSAELFQDSAFDVAALAGELIGERLGRAEGAAHTTGTGSSQPKGIVTCATAGVTAAAATAIAPDELLGLVHSLDPAYRRGNPNVGFMMHDSILLYLRKLKDGDGQYLWQPGLQAGVPDRLLGYPIAINQNMQSSVATGTVTVLFADFSKFIIRDSGTVRLYRLDELYRAKDLTGFCAFHRTDSDTIATVAIRKLTQA